jgi:hypothetical protein
MPALDRRRPHALILLLLLLAQVGLVAHRIEHYVAPQHQECGEGACTAFAPTTGAAPWVMPVAVPVRIAFFVRFWTLREASSARPPARLGFRAQAPPLRLALPACQPPSTNAIRLWRSVNHLSPVIPANAGIPLSAVSPAVRRMPASAGSTVAGKTFGALVSI